MIKADREHHRLKILLHEAAQVRDDERYMFAQYAAIVSVAVLVIGAMATVFYVTCAAGSSKCAPSDHMTPVSIWVYVGAPLLPIALIAYSIFISAILTLRSYYLRTIEREIQKLTDQADSDLPIPSWAHLQLEVTGQTHSGRTVRLNLFLLYGIIFLMVIGCFLLALHRIPDLRLQIFAVAVDGGLLAILMLATILNVMKGSILWNDALRGLPERLNRTDDGFPPRPTPPGERSLWSFLLLPRNQEELLKALFIPISFGIGASVGPGIGKLTWSTMQYPIGFFVVFEFIIYQARYLLNDVRDRKVDCKKELRKQRFPWTRDRKKLRFTLQAAFASFLVRCAIALLLVGCIFPIENWKWLWHLGFLAMVFVIAVPYETFRSKCNAASKAKLRSRRLLWTRAVIGVVGLGYGLRSVVGLWLAGVGDTGDLSRVFLGASLFGSTFVGLTWALESTRGDEAVLADGKAHLIMFRDAVSRAADRAKLSVTTSEKVLKGWQSLLAPWSLSAVLATFGLAAFAIHLVRSHLAAAAVSVSGIHVGMVWLLIFALVAIAALAVITPVPAAFSITLLSVTSLGIVLHHFSVPILQSALAATIAGLPLIVTCSFRNMRFDDLPRFTDKLIGLGVSGASHLYSWFKRAR